MTGPTGNPLPVRPQLEMLRPAFPRHRIFMRVIGDRLFYLAEAAEPGVQPRFAQAATVDRLRGKLAAPVRHFTVGEPSIPRVWDVLLGGKNNFAIDREQADQLLSVFPQAAELARESREFQRRAITHVASTGVQHFLDIGCGLPTTPNTHETAQGIQPDAAVIYVDNDEIVLSHAQSLLARDPSVLAVAGDLRFPNEIIYDWRIRQVFSFEQPICLVLTITLQVLCATRRTAVSPAQRAGIGGDVSGSDGLPVTRKCHRENSMPANRRSRPGVWGDVPGDPRDMAKAGLPESQSPEGVCMPPAGKTPETGTGPYGRVEENLP
jgi:SAM-dependent methyltransferase